MSLDHIATTTSNKAVEGVPPSPSLSESDKTYRSEACCSKQMRSWRMCVIFHIDERTCIHPEDLTNHAAIIVLIAKSKNSKKNLNR